MTVGAAYLHDSLINNKPVARIFSEDCNGIARHHSILLLQRTNTCQYQVVYFLKGVGLGSVPSALVVLQACGTTNLARQRFENVRNN